MGILKYKSNLLVSVSGGQTSGLMAKLLWDRFKDNFFMEFVFANTSREKEETLIFVDNLTKHFGIPITWVEADVRMKKGKGTGFKIVNFETACRDGSVFEKVIQGYGIPNAAFLHCTRELKAIPINKYIVSKGWRGYQTAIGYRRDEPKRVNFIIAQEKKQWYPLYEWDIKKPDVKEWWSKQEFQLGLSEQDGNCKKCYKKSDLKILSQVEIDPEDDWIERMEKKYSHHSAGRNTADNPPPYYFFRGGRSLNDIKEQYKDDKDENDHDINEQESCSESCEPF